MSGGTTSYSTRTSIKTSTATTNRLNTFRPTKPSASTQKLTTPVRNYLPPCSELNEAVFLGPKNSVFVIIDHDDLWRYDFKRGTWSREILYELYPSIEASVRGGVSCSKNLTWFFKGTSNNVIHFNSKTVLKVIFKDEVYGHTAGSH